MYVNTTPDDFEETWLNEGLSHIAEELLFYRESKLAPRSNLNLSALQAGAQTVNAFNEDMASNAGTLSELSPEAVGEFPVQRQRQPRDAWRDVEPAALSR